MNINSINTVPAQVSLSSIPIPIRFNGFSLHIIQLICYYLPLNPLLTKAKILNRQWNMITNNPNTWKYSYLMSNNNNLRTINQNIQCLMYIRRVIIIQRLTQNDLILLADNCKLLQSLTIANNQSKTINDNISIDFSIFSSHKHLTQLNISNNNDFFDSTVYPTLLSLKKLQSLSFLHTSISSSLLCQFTSDLPDLKAFSLINYDSSLNLDWHEKFFPSLNKMQNLEELILNTTNSEYAIEYLVDLPKLTRLSIELNNSKENNPLLLKPLEKCKNLTELSIIGPFTANKINGTNDDHNLNLSF